MINKSDIFNKNNIVTACIIAGIALIAFLWFSPAVFKDSEVPISGQQQPVLPDTGKPAKDTSFNRLDFKSIIVTLKSTAPLLGSDIEMRVYIDDYGAKYATVTDTKLKYNGKYIVTTEISIVSNGFTYSYDPEKKTGIKSINTNNFNPSKINFSDLNSETMETYGLRKTDTTFILGKRCDVYTLNNKAMDIEGVYDVWKNIALRTETKYNDITIDMVATRIQENVEIPAKIFQIPKGIDFTTAQGQVDTSGIHGQVDTSALK